MSPDPEPTPLPPALQRPHMEPLEDQRPGSAAGPRSISSET